MQNRAEIMGGKMMLFPHWIFEQFVPELKDVAIFM
jgi:hypothetical protein